MRFKKGMGGEGVGVGFYIFCFLVLLGVWGGWVGGGGGGCQRIAALAVINYPMLYVYFGVTRTDFTYDV